MLFPFTSFFSFAELNFLSLERLSLFTEKKMCALKVIKLNFQMPAYRNDKIWIEIDLIQINQQKLKTIDLNCFKIVLVW